MLLASLLTFVLVIVAYVVAERRRIHRAVLALVALGVGFGAMVGSIPGAIALLFIFGVTASHSSGSVAWPLWMTFAALGTLAGIGLGAGGAGKLAGRHVRRVTLRASSTALFAIVGVGLTVPFLAGRTNVSGAEAAILAAMVVATSVVGFVLPR